MVESLGHMEVDSLVEGVGHKKVAPVRRRVKKILSRPVKTKISLAKSNTRANKSVDGACEGQGDNVQFFFMHRHIVIDTFWLSF